MGILNLTPDSFSDGGIFQSKKSALEHAYRMIDEGADMIDVGGESTRPGASPITEEDEIARVVDVVKELSRTANVPISIDTSKPAVAEASLKAGASIINDVGGLRDERMIEIAKAFDSPVVIVHMFGTPKTFATHTMEGDAGEEIKRFLSGRAEFALRKGIGGSNIIVDPGIGFGKTSEQDMFIINNSGWFSDKYPVLIGPSRKRFLSQYYEGMDKDKATAAAAAAAAKSGASMLRVHNVSEVLSALKK